MANGLNQCTFTGRLGADPESRYTPGGDCVASFSLAVGSQWKDKSGEKQESTEWINVVAWRGLGEICAEYLKKGTQVLIVGRMKTEKYEKDGVTKYSTKIIAEKMQMLGSKNDGSSTKENSGHSAPSSGHKPAATAAKGNFDNFDDDIQF